MWGSPLRLLPSDAGPEDVIRRWYVETGDELTGDIAIHPLDGNVVLVQVPLECIGVTDQVTLQPHTYNPYTSSFFIFYTFSVFSHDVRVMGGLAWSAFYRLGGRVHLGRDLVKNRAFPLVWEKEFVAPARSAGATNDWFLPLSLPRSSFPFPSASIYEICHRMEWILGARLDPPAEDSTSPVALSLFECTIEDPQKRCAFSQRRLAMEKERFDHLFANMTERDVLQLFINNGLEEYMNEAMAEEPTVEDLYWFWVRYSHPPALRAGGCKPPTIIFRFAAEECPIPLPIYRGGVVHITYKEVAAWAWHNFVTQTQLLAFRNPTFPEEEWRWLSLLHNLLEGRDIWPMVPKQERVSKANPYRTNMGSAPMMAPAAAAADGDFLFENVDMEDLAMHAPPCVSACMTAFQFPKHEQRLRLLPIFQEARIPAHTVFAWFEAKNAAYPHPNTAYPDAKARFNYETLWNAKRGKTYCANIIRDTLSKGNTGSILTCPYAQLADPKAACAPHERIGFNAPHNLIKRYLGRKGVVHRPASGGAMNEGGAK